MTTQPTPADVPAGHTVRVVVPHRTYTSPVMSPGEARTEKDRLAGAAKDIGGAGGLVEFATDDGRLVSIRARQITAVEAGPPAPLRERPQPASQVHVHMHLGEVTEEAAETATRAAGFIPTPTVLAGRRRPR